MGTPIRLARANPSDEASTPTRAPISSDVDFRKTLIIKSVPMLPDPMMATLCIVFSRLPCGLSAQCSIIVRNGPRQPFHSAPEFSGGTNGSGARGFTHTLQSVGADLSSFLCHVYGPGMHGNRGPGHH